MADQRQAQSTKDSAALEQQMADAADKPAGGRMQRGRAAARNLWHACVGTAVTVRRRSGRQFQRMAKKGARLRRYRHGEVEQQAQAPREAEKPANGSRLQHLEHSLEDRFDRGRENTLHWIGVPSRREFEALEDRVQYLTEALQQMERQQREQSASSEGPARSAPRRKTASA